MTREAHQIRVPTKLGVTEETRGLVSSSTKEIRGPTRLGGFIAAARQRAGISPANPVVATEEFCCKDVMVLRKRKLDGSVSWTISRGDLDAKV